MRIAVTGRGTGGSFEIRGNQLGAAIGAEVKPGAHRLDDYDCVVVVKRPVLPFSAGDACVVWDVVDAYPQPAGNSWARHQCLHWLETQVLAIQPDAIVAATDAMAADCGMFDLPVFALPHHARPGLRRNPIRKEVTTVGYEGGVQYIERWRPIIERECKARGWAFVVNPRELADVDIVLALRDQAGYAPRHWKSNVKLANAQGSGTPCVVARECGYLETACGAEHFADNPQELSAALDALTDYEARRDASERLFKAAPQLDRIAARYRAWLAGL